MIDCADVLVPLYRLPPPPAPPGGTVLRRVLPPERHLVEAWVAKTFSPAWGAEVSVALAQTPARCLMALDDGALAGFVCFDTTFPGFFGPIGVAAAHRGRGLGWALTHSALIALRERGHAYAIVGATNRIEFWEQNFFGMPIPGSHPGPYGTSIKTEAH